MLWIGLTGGLASGKTTVAEILRKKKIPVICADQLSRLAIAEGSSGLKEVLSYFGPSVLDSTGQLDRRKLGEKVFKDKKSLLKLESIVHPIVRQLGTSMREKYKSDGHKFAFYDVPLLFEKNMQSLFDKIVLVTATHEKQMERALLRDQLSEDEIRNRLKNQLPMKEKIKDADFIIENNKGLKELEAEVEKMLQALHQAQE